MSEWQPGDVAMVSGADGVERLAMWTGHATNGPGWLIPFVGYWDFHYSFQVDPRPLAVIDPEDRAQVERLMHTFADNLGWGPHKMQRDTYVNHMQAALREFANPTPPKPEEPTGLGAVVEDAEGVQYVRTQEPVRPWASRRGELPYLDAYADITAVRVLSEGVPDV